LQTEHQILAFKGSLMWLNLNMKAVHLAYTGLL